jgi:hypothetical protein
MTFSSNATFLISFPNARYKNTKDGVLPVKSVNLGLSTGNDQTVIAAVTGKRIRVMGYKIQSATSSPGAYAFKSGSGGTVLEGGYSPSNNGLPLVMIPWDAGYFETATGLGLFADIVTHGASIQVYYIEYTP